MNDARCRGCLMMADGLVPRLGPAELSAGVWGQASCVGVLVMAMPGTMTPFVISMSRTQPADLESS